MPAPRVAANSVVGRLRLERRLYRQIIAHLQDQLPGEGCGLVAWQGDRAIHVYPGSNIHHRPETSYRMDDREVWRASEHMEHRGWHLGAIYHSHPSTPPFPSPSDVANSWWSDVYTLIVSFRERTPELRAFLIERASASYQEVPVDIEPERAGGWRHGMPFPRRRHDPDPEPPRSWQPVSQTLPVLPGIPGVASLPTAHAPVLRGSTLSGTGEYERDRDRDRDTDDDGREAHRDDHRHPHPADPLTVEMPLPPLTSPAPSTAEPPLTEIWDADASAPPPASRDHAPATHAGDDVVGRNSLRTPDADADMDMDVDGAAQPGGQHATQDTQAGSRHMGMAMQDPGATRTATIGILGGMGPAATADLYRKIIELTPAASDQEHIPVVIWADPRVPDRTEALLNNGEDPTPWLVRGAQALADMGADFVVIPCNTAHAFEGPLQAAVPRPILSMIAAAADAIVRDAPEAETIGLLATSGTIAAELYQQALLERGRDVIVPDDETQERCVMTAIRAVKRGQADHEATALMQEAAAELTQRGAGALLAACTEIPLIFRQEHTDTMLIDATATLAEAAVATAQYLNACARDGQPVWHMADDAPATAGAGQRRD